MGGGRTAVAVAASPLAAPPDPAAFRLDEHGHVLLRPAVHSQTVVRDPLDPQHCTLPINDRAFHYETDLFSGRALVMLRHLPNSPEASAFAGKRRTCFVAVQGRFKRPVRCDALVMGADFQRPLHLPARMFLAGTRLGGWIARQMGGNLQMQLKGPRPYAHSRVITAAQAIHACGAGDKPPELTAEAEDLRLLDPTAADENGNPLCIGRRRAHFNSQGRASRLHFSPDHVYTITFFNHEMHYGAFVAHMPLMGSICAARLLNGGPSMFMLREKLPEEDRGRGGEGKKGGAVLHVEVWHDRVLPLAHAANARDAERAEKEEASAAERRRRAAGGGGGGGGGDGADAVDVDARG
ncbi:hypothetical protein Rsub_08490 [Raphidocelis subcapitata]|uniref:Domain of unknown function at the cortex 1 domain-containing protein n=1 Tax=Raphidocelis subcapitata TaxID=307507 RepID=A0A2V0P8K6_9CHLO|nr:hypothetical protein Rsub_08490 [Raphidocelis subcapitata]|eukprot:GBF95899.1 hypothetical protein Rsub_08490 [Raphidocelis subcapitata]